MVARASPTVAEGLLGLAMRLRRPARGFSPLQILLHSHHFAADEVLAFVADVDVPDGGALGRGGTVDLLAVDF
ncbi:MAG TPA: hypothetical protein DGP39_08175 [Verrucomicrobiales bacterium]|nr:hypothetical protein [Verrucomicrobiales bacterium]